MIKHGSFTHVLPKDTVVVKTYPWPLWSLFHLSTLVVHQFLSNLLIQVNLLNQEVLSALLQELKLEKHFEQIWIIMSMILR